MSDTRKRWLDWLDRMVRPVLAHAAAGDLGEAMPRECRADCDAGRLATIRLEAAGRVLAGIAPWLAGAGGDARERALREEFGGLALDAIRTGTDPDHPDWWGFGEAAQSVVDGAFLAQAILRAPDVLCAPLTDDEKARVASALQRTRRWVPGFNNWLLFSACTEAVQPLFGAEPDRMRIDYALRQHEQWYLGDGHYGDGPRFHADYYNSFVIQPMQVDVLEAMDSDANATWRTLLDACRVRLSRYAAVQERMIAADGTWPPLGRSICYRCGAFHALGFAAWKQLLPSGLPPAQVRCALTAAIDRCLSAPGTFTPEGWLTIGLAGHQPALGEAYITTASTYLASFAFAALGLPPDDPFWADPDVPWTQVRIWQDGADVPADKPIPDNLVKLG